MGRAIGWRGVGEVLGAGSEAVMAVRQMRRGRRSSVMCSFSKRTGMAHSGAESTLMSAAV
jgi:hypothetical protein